MSSPRLRRILTLDGGGIRGIFSLQILARIEDHFRTARGAPGLVLADEFDFFAGTSTGAIIAACLAWGMSVADVEKLYIERGAEMFAPMPWWQRWKGKYRADAIADFFRGHFCEQDEARTPALLGTRRLWRGDEPKYLLMVMRNASTGSPWPVCNNPRAKYNDPALPDSNLRVPLWQLLRASTAAPTYFPPEQITLGPSQFLFVDGGISPYNNPALIAVLMATLPQFHIDWPTGASRLQVVSVGTGSERARLKKHEAAEVHMLDQAAFVIPALLGSVAIQQDMLCRVLGRCDHGDPIDSEVGALTGAGMLAETEKKFAYVRYNREFTSSEIEGLQRETGQKFSLDNLALIPYLQKVGREFAARTVQSSHLLG
jgi:hypothetical protein